MLCDIHLWPLWKMWDFMFHESRPMAFHPCFIVFTLSNQHCVMTWWCLHVGRRCHCQPHSSRFGVVTCSCLWGCNYSCDWSEGWFLLQLIVCKYVSPFSYKGFWVFTLVIRLVFLSMCQFCEEWRALKVFLSQFTHIL